MRVFITDYFHEAEIERSILGPEVEVSCLETIDEHRFPSEIAEADALLVWHAELTAQTIRRLSRCRIIARYGVGCDNIDLEAARAQSIPVTNVPDYGTDEVADTTMAMLLNLARGISQYHARNLASADTWDYTVIPQLRRVKGRVLGIIGLGRIGTAVALRAKACGITVRFYDPYKEEGIDKVLGVERCEALADLLASSDWVSIHATLTPETCAMIDERALSLFKPGAVLLNTARGSIIQSLDVLWKGLERGVLGAVALDVLPQEPPDTGHPLIKAFAAQDPWLRHRLILTPHAGFYSQEAMVEMRQKAAMNVRRCLDGEPLRYLVGGRG